MDKRIAIITGVTGQDGSYMADLLLEKGYKVYGLKRRTTDHKWGCSSHLQGVQDFEMVEGDLTDHASLLRLCRTAKAHEFYNLGAQSHVGSSFEQPHFTLEATGHGALNCLEAIRQSGFQTKYYQASTSELWGGICPPQGGYDESSVFYPRSPYAVAKLAAHWYTINYRESHRMYACAGTLCNHESERRGANFVTRKITMAVAKIKLGKATHVSLGNLDARRDWGHAKDYVRGMWMMLQQSQPKDYVLGTGTAYSVRDFCKIAFEHAGLGDYQQYVRIDPAFLRPAEVNVLIGNSSLAQKELGWTPTISFQSLVQMMVDHDIAMESGQAK